MDANIPYMDVRLALVRAGECRSMASGVRGLVVGCYSREFGARALLWGRLPMPTPNLLLLALCLGRRPQCSPMRDGGWITAGVRAWGEHTPAPGQPLSAAGPCRAAQFAFGVLAGGGARLWRLQAYGARGGEWGVPPAKPQPRRTREERLLAGVCCETTIW